MNEKPSPKSSAPKPASRSAGSGAPSGAKGAASTDKSKPGDDRDETFNFFAPPQKPDEIGRLAHYRVLKVLGRGGMGTVFMAEDTRLHRIVALKMMLPSIAKKPVARDRFIREARATAAIEHDHIITIYEVNGDSEVPYAAMQYLKGMTLDDWLRAGKTLNVPQIMRIAKEIAKGLAAAHACQLIHRDIKPSNIWLDAVNKGRVKILDFGLARPTNEETHLTQEGLILGTPAYMSPEQARGQSVDERCDLFSLGCVLYRLCTGKLPFTGKDALSMLLAIASVDPPPLQPLNADVPTAFADLVHKLLAKKPEDRPESAKSVAQTIQDIERDWIASGKTIASKTSPVANAPGSTNQDETIAVSKVGGMDPALEESAITELELQETHIPGVKEAPARSRYWLIGGLGATLIFVFLILCCLGIAVATDRGHIEIVAADDAAKEFVEKTGLTVVDHHKTAHPVKLGVYPLSSGGYKFEQTGLPDGLRIEPTQFSLQRNETLAIKISFVKPIRPELVVVTPGEARKIQAEWAAYLKRDVVEKNSLDAKLTLIPPGEFMMGSTRIDFFLKKLKKDGLPEGFPARFASEGPLHRVQITKPFYFGSTEVTVGQFKKFVAAQSYTTEASIQGGTGLDAGAILPERKPEFNWRTPGPGYTVTDDHPVSNITWKDAEKFCEWLSKKEKKVYRLPTEAEWEYACRAGTTEQWSMGDDPRESHQRGYMWYNVRTSFLANPVTPKVVAQKKPNDFGLFDMHGNIAEMCFDQWGAAYYERCVREGIVADPKGPDLEAGAARVVRGGSFSDASHMARSAYRHFLNPTLGYVQVGFRIVCETPD